jgi:PTS system glucose-specific IIA component
LIGGIFLFEFIAPLSGKVINLSKVPDRVFSSKLAGEGVAIDATDDLVLAPADGQLSLILNNNHAFCMKLDNGIVLVVHIGIDTVELKGEGFQRLIEDGIRVKAGDPIIKIDRDKVIKEGYSLITPVLITNMDLIDEIKYFDENKAEAGKTVIMSCKIK